jgi:hypothetical protein
VTRKIFGIPAGLMEKHPNISPKPYYRKRKNVTVMKATVQNRWISHISPIQSFEELQKFIVLWEGVNTVNMMEYSEDEIKWKWTPDS